MSHGWTEDRVDSLKKLWIDGLSASQIARQLGGGVTRNAVIGKVHRLGLTGRAEPSRPRRAAPMPPRPGRVAQARPRTSPPPRPVPPPPARPAAARFDPALALDGTATAATLGAHMCKWPIGDPGSDAFRFCGRPAPNRDPYCPEHRRVGCQPRKAAPLADDPIVRRVLAGLAA
ncbi:GcrA family cell cycle regulator (plasmid) [Brevundimonas staleyi]|uniref:GcrA family cell cycle regulator n=1 Tax=Brevundimonas staleyi TaxID=74326 RepID=A0ABW0FMD5_9CAUL